MNSTRRLPSTVFHVMGLLADASCAEHNNSIAAECARTRRYPLAAWVHRCLTRLLTVVSSDASPHDSRACCRRSLPSSERDQLAERAAQLLVIVVVQVEISVCRRIIGRTRR